MFSFINNFYYPSRLLSDAEFQLMCAGARISEQDEHGIKVMRLANGDKLKIFRVKKFFSGAIIYSYARRFCRNAKRLSALGVTTVKIKKLYHFENNSNTAVLYVRLEGQTLRKIIHKGSFDLSLAEKLGDFLAELHHKGIHFHSLHAGNILLTPNGQLGLIDISDLSIYAWRLMLNTRIRSFKRFLRYEEDIKRLGKKNWEIVLASYIKSSGLNDYKADSLRTQIDNIYSSAIDLNNN